MTATFSRKDYSYLLCRCLSQQDLHFSVWIMMQAIMDHYQKSRAEGNGLQPVPVSYVCETTGLSRNAVRSRANRCSWFDFSPGVKAKPGVIGLTEAGVKKFLKVYQAIKAAS